MFMRKIARIFFYTSIFAILFCHPVYGSDDILIRLSPQPDSPWVGEKVVLQVDVLSKNGWAQLKSLRHAEIPGGFLRRYETQGTRLNETIDGESYTGQRYEFLFFPQRPGKLSIPAIPIDVEIKTWGQGGDTKTKRSQTPSFTLNVKKTGAKQNEDGLISTSSFSAEQTWSPLNTDLSAGDAITRTITLQAKDVSGMVFAPLKQIKVAKISDYPAEPVVNDTYNRGDLQGSRVEKITYLFETGGDFKLPDYSFSWWDTKTKELKTVILEGKTIEVSGQAAAIQTTEEQVVGKIDSRLMMILIACACVVAAFLFSLRTRMKNSFTNWRKRRNESESKYFKEVAKATGKNDVNLLLMASMRWLDRISTDNLPARMDLFLHQYGEDGAEELFYEILKLDSGQTTPKQISQFYRVLAKSRKNWKKICHQKKKAEHLLPKMMLH